MSADEKKAIEQKLLAECQSKEGASDADVSELAARNVPTTQTGKCLHACVHEMLGLVSEQIFYLMELHRMIELIEIVSKTGKR